MVHNRGGLGGVVCSVVGDSSYWERIKRLWQLEMQNKDYPYPHGPRDIGARSIGFICARTVLKLIDTQRDSLSNQYL